MDLRNISQKKVDELWDVFHNLVPVEENCKDFGIPATIFLFFFNSGEGLMSSEFVINLRVPYDV